MDILIFSCIDVEGENRDCQYGGPNVEPGFDILNNLVREGVQLTQVQWQCDHLFTVRLPVEAFDGCSISEPLRQLEREWQMLLSTE